METITVTAIQIASSKVFNIEIQLDEYETTDEVVITAVTPQETVSVSGEYYFNTFQLFRDKLLQLGIGLKCYGALLNACQSPMASYSQKIYLVTLDKQAITKDLFDIFEYTEIETFPNTNEQNLFYQKWIKSLGR